MKIFHKLFGTNVVQNMWESRIRAFYQKNRVNLSKYEYDSYMTYFGKQQFQKNINTLSMFYVPKFLKWLDNDNFLVKKMVLDFRFFEIYIFDIVITILFSLFFKFQICIYEKFDVIEEIYSFFQENTFDRYLFYYKFNIIH